MSSQFAYLRWTVARHQFRSCAENQGPVGSAMPARSLTYREPTRFEKPQAQKSLQISCPHCVRN